MTEERSKTAPGGLEHIRLFVNTVDLEHGTEELATPADLAAWLAERGLGRVRCDAQDLAAAIRLREAIRQLALANNREPADLRRATADLDEAATEARVLTRFGTDGISLEPDRPGARGALGRLVAIIAMAMADGSWSRMKACASDSCQWVFYDGARNRSGRWCQMAVCGNREKARTYRRRAGDRA